MKSLLKKKEVTYILLLSVIGLLLPLALCKTADENPDPNVDYCKETKWGLCALGIGKWHISADIIAVEENEIYTSWNDGHSTSGCWGVWWEDVTESHYFGTTYAWSSTSGTLKTSWGGGGFKRAYAYTDVTYD